MYRSGGCGALGVERVLEPPAAGQRGVGDPSPEGRDDAEAGAAIPDFVYQGQPVGGPGDDPEPLGGRTCGRPATSLVSSAMCTRSACGRSPRIRALPLPSVHRMKPRPEIPVAEPMRMGAPVFVGSFVRSG